MLFFHPTYLEMGMENMGTRNYIYKWCRKIFWKDEKVLVMSNILFQHNDFDVCLFQCKLYEKKAF